MRNYPLNEVILPMGATKPKTDAVLKQLMNDPNYVAETKLDGVRELMISARCFSRRISDVDGLPVEKSDRVPHLTAAFEAFPLLIVDGEFYYEGMTSNEVNSILGAKPEKAIARQEERGKLKFKLYDILRDMDGTWLIDQPWTLRRKVLEQVYPFLKSEYVELSAVVETDIEAFLESILARGGEGIMLKNKNGKYVPGKKPANNWVKVKTEIEDDVVIVGFQPAVKEYTGKELLSWEFWEDKETGKLVDRVFPELEALVYDEFKKEYMPDERYSQAYVDAANEVFEKYMPVTKYFRKGWVGSIIFGKFDTNGILIELGACSGFDESTRAQFSDDQKKFIGECIKITAMEKTADGFYRHPQYCQMRPDKNPSECVLN